MENSQKNNRITPFAVTDYRDIRKLFGIKQKNRRGHMYIIGKTGTGKSTLIENMAISDIKNGYGVALIDPHGDMAEEILDYVPKKRIKDVIYFNPADLENPIAFNPLEKVPKDFHHLVASGIVSTFKKIWSESWGPRLEHILRHALLSLLEYPNSTLLDLPKLLTDKDFRKSVLNHITHPQVREFWLSEFDKYSVWLRSEAISPILNKISQFLISIPLRNIVSQKENTFDVRQAMDEGKILIVNLAKGKIGEDNCSLLGALVVTKIQLAALSRVDLPEENRKPFYLYVDEIHSFITLSFADILSEARKYGLNLVLAHQYIDQLDERIRAAIFGNIGTIISFRIGAEDAKYLAQEFAPVFNEEDLIKLPNFNIYLKLMIDGVASHPFSAITLRLRDINTSHKNEIIDFSRKRYTKPRDEVEKDILYRPSRLPDSYGHQLSF